MSLFDIFTGDSAREAAEANQGRLTASKGAGMGYLDSGRAGALTSLTNAGGQYTDYAKKYAPGTDLYLNSLGVNGAAGNDAATKAFQAGPGYRWGVDQALEGVNRHAAATGSLTGGNTLAALSDRAGNMANQEYGNWQSRLAGLMPAELSGVAGAAGAEAGKAPVYMNDANQRVGLETGTTNNINSQETQAANAEMQGSQNLWNFGLQGASALASGGTSLLGGGGLAGLGGGGQSMANPYGMMPRAGRNF